MLFPCLFRQVPSPRTLRGTFPRDHKRNQGKGELNQVEIVIFLIFRTVARLKCPVSYLPPPVGKTQPNSSGHKFYQTPNFVSTLRIWGAQNVTPIGTYTKRMILHAFTCEIRTWGTLIRDATTDSDEVCNKDVRLPDSCPVGFFFRHD